MNLNSFLSQVNNPLAHKTQWTALSNFRSSTPTHKIKHVNKNRLEFVPVKSYQVLLVCFALMGVFLIFLAINRYNTKNWIIILILGTLFFLFALYMLFSTKKAKVFDKELGYFWIGSPNLPVSRNKDSIKIEDISALQILVTEFSGNTGWDKSYELNAIKENSNRINILSHGGHKEKFVGLAEELSEFLQIPLWNIMDSKYKA